MGRRVSTFYIGLATALLVGLAVRLAVIASPLGEIDGDEAVVGLMARHIAFLGELPVFYWGQPYLGSLEALTAAPLFRVFNSSTFLLKLVPTVYSLAFLALSAALTRRLFGTPAALATAAYLALPPAMWAVWSTKARGGYAEVLFLGQALLLATLVLAEKPNRRLALAWGVLAGLAFWTHLLAVVYIVPAVVFLVLARRLQTRPGGVASSGPGGPASSGPGGVATSQQQGSHSSAAWSVDEVGLALAGGLLGMAPLVVQNVSDGFLTLGALLQPPDVPLNVIAQFVRFFRVGVPVLLGLGQPTTSETMFDQDWPLRPAGHAWIAALALLVVLGAVATYWPAVPRLIKRCGSRRAAEPALLVMLVLVVPPVIALTRFGVFVSEPRYALPLYSAVPLLAGALWRLPLRGPGLAAVLRWTVVGAVLGFNVASLLSTDQRLWRPQDTLESTAATRADLVTYLVAGDRHQIYTDYWIGYPLMFETRETVLAYVISGGFNRYVPPADNVQRTPNPAWVFTSGMVEAHTAFVDALQAAGGQAQVTDVSVYRVYTDVQPLAALRPPGLISNPALGLPP